MSRLFLDKLIVFLFFISTNFCFGQKIKQIQVRDTEAWMSLNLKYKPFKRLSFDLEEQLRLKENASALDLYFTEFSSGYDLFKNFNVAAGFRYSTENDNVGKKQGHESFFRYHVDMSFKYKLNRFGVKHRLRFQDKNQLGFSKREGDVHLQALRLKNGVSYNIKKTRWEPYLDTELFYRLKNIDDSALFNKFRLTSGISYPFKKWGEIDLFYRLEKDLNQSYPKSSHIFGMSYGYTIN